MRAHTRAASESVTRAMREARVARTRAAVEKTAATKCLLSSYQRGSISRIRGARGFKFSFGRYANGGRGGGDE